MGDRLGIQDAVDFFHTDASSTTILGQTVVPPIAFFACLPGKFGFMARLKLPSKIVYGHITLNTPVLVRSLKLSKVESC